MTPSLSWTPSRLTRCGREDASTGQLACSTSSCWLDGVVAALQPCRARCLCSVPKALTVMLSCSSPWLRACALVGVDNCICYPNDGVYAMPLACFLCHMPPASCVPNDVYIDESV